MACTVLSEDILVVCLLLADGNLHVPLETVICRAEGGPVDQFTDLCIAPDEWRGLFVSLFWPDPEATEVAHRRSNRSLASIAPLVLAYGGAYLNDEGEHWQTAEDVAAQAGQSWGEPWQYTNDTLSSDDRQMRLALRRRLQGNDHLESLSPDCVKRCMHLAGIGQGTLAASLQPHWPAPGPRWGPDWKKTGEP